MIGYRSILVAVCVALAPGAAPGQSVDSTDAGFRSFLPAFEAATRAMLNGDSASWTALLSTEPGGTLFTPFGGVVLGAPALKERYAQAAARHAPGPATLEVEYLSIDVSGDLATVVALERSRLRMAGSDSMRAGYTRATMIFRREGGRWKLRHRHMDHLRERPPPAPPTP